MLKKRANGRISIEKFDDIAFEDDDYGQCLIQAKHHIKPKPLGDKSVDLWKTIRVWIEQFQDGIISANSTKYVLITTATAPEDSAMAKLRPESTATSRGEARELLRKAAQESNNDSTKEGRKAFLALKDTEVDLFLSSIEVYDEHSNLIDVMEEIEGELILLSPTHVSTIAQYLEGWWLSVVGKHLVDEHSNNIPVQDIIVKASEIGNWFKDDGLPIDDPETLGTKEYSEDDEDAIFVRQMRLVQLSDRAVQRGVQDYYRSSAQRSKWARENLLLDGETYQYDQKLKDRWGRKFDADCSTLDDTADDGKMKAGRSLCYWAAQEQIGFRNVVETWITAGSFHGLSDRLEIGWHPDFQNHFTNGGNDGEN